MNVECGIILIYNYKFIILYCPQGNQFNIHNSTFQIHYSGTLSYIEFHQLASSFKYFANHAKMVFCHFTRFS